VIGSELANHIGVRDGDLIEYVPQVGTPIRAWLKVVAGLEKDEAPVGPLGRRMLKVREGDLIEIRAVRTEALE